MKLIKLDAIDSTNDFLKGLVQKNNLENFTVVMANSQTNGKGQMGSSWNAEFGKNLTFSILLNNPIITIDAVFNLNIVITVSLFQVLNQLNINDLHIKWPNDIMSENKKIAGILIENLLKENGEIKSIVGIGLNVNQTNFDHLPKASSLKNIMHQDFNIDFLLENIVSKIEENIAKFKNNEIDVFWNEYQNNLFKKGKPALFETNRKQFMGIIQKVNRFGLLEIIHEDDSINQYDIKEVLMLY